MALHRFRDGHATRRDKRQAQVPPILASSLPTSLSSSIKILLSCSGQKETKVAKFSCLSSPPALRSKSAGTPAHSKTLARHPINFGCLLPGRIGRLRPAANPAALGHSASAPHFDVVRRADGAGATRPESIVHRRSCRVSSVIPVLWQFRRRR